MFILLKKVVNQFGKKLLLQKIERFNIFLFCSLSEKIK